MAMRSRPRMRKTTAIYGDVVQAKPVFELVERRLRVVTAEQVVDDRPGDGEASNDNEDHQRNNSFAR